jgi:hypothetical protein
MPHYIESWRVCKRVTKLEIALRSIASDKRAKSSERLRACELLMEIERDRVERSSKRNDINSLNAIRPIRREDVLLTPSLSLDSPHPSEISS